MIANALYNMVSIYRDRVGDQELSDETFHDFCKRFPNHELLVDLYYMQYLTALKNNDMLKAEQYRQQIIAAFPESNEAYIVSQPDYFQRLQRMAQEQDSLYEHTYQAYTQNNFAAVKTNKLYAEENYPLSPLMPRFLLLTAIAVAKTDGQPAFIVQLQEMVARYPESELAAMAKDMLALMGQGAESQQGEVASLKERRAQQSTDSVAADSVAVQFSTERNLPAMVLLVMENDEPKSNQLLYEVALFNFSQFMIKDFDLKLLPTFEANTSALQIAGFEKMDEAEWYINLLQKNATILQFMQANNVQVVAITEENFKLLNTHFSLQDYLPSL